MADECGLDGVVTETWSESWTMRSADDWEVANRPEHACIKECLCCSFQARLCA